jgi:hypothetical protein
MNRAGWPTLCHLLKIGCPAAPFDYAQGRLFAIFEGYHQGRAAFDQNCRLLRHR